MLWDGRVVLCERVVGGRVEGTATFWVAMCVTEWPFRDSNHSERKQLDHREWTKPTEYGFTYRLS